jgi:hypothetical protein
MVNKLIMWTALQLQRIKEALENKPYCSAPFLDTSQAFDKVWHTGFLYRLRLSFSLTLSLSLNYFLALKLYLHSRHFLIKVEMKYNELSLAMLPYPKAISYGHFHTCYKLRTCHPHQNLPQQLLPRYCSTSHGVIQPLLN